VRISAQFTDRSAIPGPDDQHPFDIRIGCHRYMDDHIVINELIFFCYHHQSVKREKLAKFFGMENINALKFALTLIQAADRLG
jgi:hypothetical protein